MAAATLTVGLSSRSPFSNAARLAASFRRQVADTVQRHSLLVGGAVGAEFYQMADMVIIVFGEANEQKGDRPPDIRFLMIQCVE